MEAISRPMRSLELASASTGRISVVLALEVRNNTAEVIWPISARKFFGSVLVREVLRSGDPIFWRQANGDDVQQRASIVKFFPLHRDGFEGLLSTSTTDSGRRMFKPNL